MENGESHRSQLKLHFRFKPLTLAVPEERKRLFSRLQVHMALLDEILASDDLQIQLRGILVGARLIQVALKVIKDAELENVERELSILKKRLEVLKERKERKKLNERYS